MARPLRIEYPGAVYHVTSRGNARKNIFKNDADRNDFLATLGRVVERFGCEEERGQRREGSSLVSCYLTW